MKIVTGSQWRTSCGRVWTVEAEVSADLVRLRDGDQWCHYPALALIAAMMPV